MFPVYIKEQFARLNHFDIRRETLNFNQGKKWRQK